jgi:hypothetical protein
MYFSKLFQQTSLYFQQTSLYSNKLVYTILDEFKDDLCNIFLMKVQFGTTTITLGSIYGPNTDNVNFYNHLKIVIE